MNKCINCEREFTSTRGLKMHMNKCSTKTQKTEYSEEIQLLIEEKNQAMDAEHRHNLELLIAKKIAEG